MNALILFVKDPVPGNVKTRLGTTIGMESAAQLYRVFAESSFAIAAEMVKHSTRVFIWYAPGTEREVIQAWVGNEEFEYAEQRGDSLGDRMRYAFHEAFRYGATKAVILGTDIPELDLPLVATAFRSLLEHDVVIGPSTDGGYYLLGMVTPGVEVFEGVPWSTAGALPATLRLVEQSHATFALLAELSDIDTLEDYHRFLSRQRESHINGTTNTHNMGP
jgi:rSAM/selenodomain-associated transferase 1